MSGPQGIQGDKGDTGDNGICDCFNISSIAFDEVNATNSFNLGVNSTFSCAAGATIDPSCLTVGTCPDFSPCRLQMQGATISNGVGSAALLQVGMAEETIPSQVSFGAPSFAIGGVYARAYNVVLEGNGVDALIGGQTVLRARNGGEVRVEANGMGGVVTLNSVGDIVNTAPTGRFSVLCGNGGIRLINSDNLNPIVLDSEGDIDILGGGGQAVRIRSDNFTLIRDSGEPNIWMRTAVTSLDYITGAVNPFGSSLNFAHDLTLGPSIAIISEDTYLRLGPSVDVGSGLITSVSSEILRLRTGTFLAGEAISLEAPVINNASLPVAFNSSGTDGVMLQDGYLFLNDEQGTNIAGGDLLINASLTHVAQGNLIVDPGRIQSIAGNTLKLQTGTFSGSEYISLEAPIRNEVASLPAAVGIVSAGHLWMDDDVKITGNLRIDGDIEITGNLNAVTCSGCASDKRVKKNIQPISMLDSVNRILHLDAVSYKFKRAYQAVDKWVGDEVHHGFIAQEVKKHFPFAVKTRKAHGHDDFHSLHKDMIVPDLVNMVKHMHTEIQKLKSEVRHLRRTKKNKTIRGRAKFN